MKREYRILKASQVRASQDGKGISGYAAVFNQLSEDLGWFREMVMPGAFTRCLSGSPDVRCLFNHDSNSVLGRTKSGTLRLKEDNTGLQFDCDLPDTQLGRDVREMIARGDIDQCSFGFMVNEQNWREEKDKDGMMQTTRELTDVDLFDVSPVTFAAYPQTSVSMRELWPDGVPDEVAEHRADEKKTKRVDDEDLTADAFIIVGDSDDPETWRLPWKFSTEEKTKSHLRNALARFNQLKGLSEEDKKKAWNKLVKLCKEHDIDVTEEVSLRLKVEMVRVVVDVKARRLLAASSKRQATEKCQCECPECQAGNCADCSDEDCDDPNCEDEAA